MPRNEDGEYELILGNRQLLSIFFIVVVLLGSGFTLGYMLGRNSGPAGARTESAEARPAPGLPPLNGEPPPPFLQQAQQQQPQKPEPAAQPPAAPVTKAASPAPEPAVPAKPSAAKGNETAAAGAFRTGAPPEGSAFIQATYTNQADAERTAETIGKQLGLPMWVSPHEVYKDQFRVLVGPFADRAELSGARTKVAALGFKDAFAYSPKRKQ